MLDVESDLGSNLNLFTHKMMYYLLGFGLKSNPTKPHNSIFSREIMTFEENNYIKISYNNYSTNGYCGFMPNESI
jgi:hypothetical protein